MTTNNIAYGADTALAVAAWTTTLAAGEWATSAIFDNSSSLFVDVLIGGVIELSATTPVAGDTMDVYICAQYSDTATDMTGGIDALLGAAVEEVEDVSFVKANLILMVSVSVEATTPATAQGYHWGSISVASFFGGIMPKRFMLLLNNNTAGALAAGSDVNTIGITHTDA